MDNQMYKVLMASLAMTRQCWEQGMLSYALIPYARKDESIKKILKNIVYDMVLRQSDDGRLCNIENTSAVTDSAFCVPATLFIAGDKNSKSTSDKDHCWNNEWYKAALRNVSFLLFDAERSKDCTLYHIKGTSEVWADSAAFLPYVFVISGYPEQGYREMKNILKKLYLKDSGLYAHIWDEKRNKLIDERPWGVGNGWILTGLLRTAIALKDIATSQEKKYEDLVLPSIKERWNAQGKMINTRKASEDLLSEYCRLLNRMLEFESPDHGFHDVLDDSTSFEETETAVMVACSIYRGVNAGFLDTNYAKSVYLEKQGTYLSRADEIRRAVLNKIDAEGKVMDASSSPSFDKPGTSVECQAHVLLMEELRNQLAFKLSTEIL